MSLTPPVFQEPFNVRAFGAVGDGVHDDTAAIQAAIDAASAGLGGVVYLPPGGYRTSAPLTLPTDSISLVGAGVETRGVMGPNCSRMAVLTRLLSVR